MLKRYYLFGILLFCLVPIPFLLAQTAVPFALSFIPESSTLPQGGRTGISMNVTGKTSDTGWTPVTFIISQGLPAGLKVEFSPSSCVPPCNSILTVSADLTAPPGTFVIPVAGAALGQTATASFNVTVAALPKFDYSIALISSSGSAATGEQLDTTLNLNQLSGRAIVSCLAPLGSPAE